MAWAPTTNFEEDLVDLQPDCNFIFGQLAYEAANRSRSQDFTPRPKSTYDYLAKREKRNQEIAEKCGTRSKEISDSLAMMERIQEIAGTKSLGEHATMADWEDRSTVEQEVVAMMRHFGMKSMAEGCLEPSKDDDVVQPKGKVHIIRNGRQSFPLILDPNYFEPGRNRRKTSDVANTSRNESSIYTDSNESFESESSAPLYKSAQSQLDDTNSSSQNSGSYVDIPYQLLESLDIDPEQEMAKVSKPKNRRRDRRSQK